MPKTVTSPIQKKLAAMLIELRKEAGLRQVDLAEKLGVYQSWVTHMESSQRRIDVVELIELSRILGFDPADSVRNGRTSDSAAGRNRRDHRALLASPFSRRRYAAAPLLS